VVVNNPMAAGARWTDISRAAAAMAALIGAAVLSSWVFEGAPDAAFAAEFGAMKSLGALAFVLLGGALALLPSEFAPFPRRRRAVAVVSAVVLAFALLTALQHVLDVRLYDRPTPGSAMLFSAAALALLLLASRARRDHALAQVLGCVVLFAGLIALVAYAFDLNPQQTVPYLSISAQSSLAFIFLAGGILLARPSAMPMEVLLRELPSARLGRVLILGVLLIIPALGWIWLEGVQRRIFSQEFGAALMVASSIAVLALFIWVSAGAANEAEAHVDRLRRLYAALSRTNQTITRFRDEHELLSGVCNTAVEQGGFRFAWIAWTNPEATRFEPAAAAAAPTGFIDDCVRDFRHFAALPEMVRTRLAHQIPVFVNDIDSDPVIEMRRERFRRAGVRSVAAIPIQVGDRLVALLLVYSSEADVFAQEERELLREMANDVGFALQQLEHGKRHRQTVVALQHTESRLGSILASLTSGIWSVDPGTHAMLYANPAFERIFGLTAADLRADPALRFRDVHADDRAALMTFYDRIAREDQASVEYRLGRGGGEWRWIAERGWAVREDGRILRYDGIASDFTERRRTEEEIRRLNATLERRVADRTAQLESANRELNAFSYSVSHDLRAPLRAIEGFSALLLERIGGRLEGEELGFLQRIRRGVERMSSLIEGMLQLARLSTQPLARSRVDLSACAREVADELQRDAPPRNVQWHIQPGLAVQGDPPLLRAVMENLVGNSFKFTSRVENAVIEVGSLMQQGETVLFVRDNGAGFDMAFSDRLFDAFHRMHGEQEFPGTGIGLATVKRIISRHGGRIWAEAQPGVGATFYFTIGRQDPEESNAG
jgi:PAS domain S-box-containing protein